jgi:hypothetical protein
MSARRLKLITDVAIKRTRGVLKRKPGETLFRPSWADTKKKRKHWKNQNTADFVLDSLPRLSLEGRALSRPPLYDLESAYRDCYHFTQRAMSDPVKYITDDRGERTAVVLPISDYEKLLEDLKDLAVVAERRGEPTIPH